MADSAPAVSQIHEHESDRASGLATRRDFIRRTGFVAGGALWVSPVVQVVNMASAGASTSPVSTTMPPPQCVPTDIVAGSPVTLVLAGPKGDRGVATSANLAGADVVLAERSSHRRARVVVMADKFDSPDCPRWLGTYPIAGIEATANGTSLVFAARNPSVWGADAGASVATGPVTVEVTKLLVDFCHPRCVLHRPMK